MGEIAAVEFVLADNPVDVTKVQQLLQYQATQIANDSYGYGYAFGGGGLFSPVSLQLCQKLCQAIIESKDVTLPKKFIKAYFSRLQEKRQLVPDIAELVRKVTWGLVRDPLISIINQQTSLAERMGVVLGLADALMDNPVARSYLTLTAVENARSLCNVDPDTLASSSDLGILWKHAMACASQQVLIDLSNLFMRMNGKLLGPVVKILSTVNRINAEKLPFYQSTLRSLASKRQSWLLAEVARMSKPFTYEVPATDFPGAAELVAFLRGSDPFFCIRGFTGIAHARSRVALLNRKIKGTLTLTAEGRGQNALVRVVKGGSDFNVRKQNLPIYKAEFSTLERLVSSVGAAAIATGAKRAREEKPGVIGLD